MEPWEQLGEEWEEVVRANGLEAGLGVRAGPGGRGRISFWPTTLGALHQGLHCPSPQAGQFAG